MLKFINIKGSKWRIKLEMGLGDDKSKSELGSTTFDNKVIRISKESSGQERQAIFWHEFIHAVLHEIYASQLISDELEEIIADNIATAITKVMNNELLKHGLEDEDE